MTTPNRPPDPHWYRKRRPVPAHIGPTQRDLLARRIRSMQRFLIGTSLIGVAAFTTLAAWHTESKSNAAAQTTTTQVVQPSTTATEQTTAITQPGTAVADQATATSQSIFGDEESSGFTAETRSAIRTTTRPLRPNHRHSDDDSSAVAATTPVTTTQAATTTTSAASAASTPAPTTSTSSQTASVGSQTTTAPTSSGRQTKTATS